MGVIASVKPCSIGWWLEKKKKFTLIEVRKKKK